MINTYRFEGYVTQCPKCGHEDYWDDEDLVEGQMDDGKWIRCSGCQEEYEVES